MNSPKYIEINYKLLIMIILNEKLKNEDYNKPFGISSLMVNRDISSFFNIIYNRKPKKGKI